MGKIKEIERLMLKLSESHSMLSQAEYRRNPKINNESPIFKIEFDIIDSWKKFFGRDYFEALNEENDREM